MDRNTEHTKHVIQPIEGDPIMSLGEMILDHYTKYLGNYAGAERYYDGNKDIQILGFPNVFKDCIVFATFGLSKYPETIKKRCEVVLAVDDKFDECAEIFANAVFYILSNKMEFGRGILIDGADGVVKGFSASNGKTALYFTEATAFPEDFLTVNNQCTIYMGFFVSEREAEYFRENGCEKFEDLLEENDVDVMSLNRESVI